MRVRVFDEIDDFRRILGKAYSEEMANCEGLARQHHLIRDKENHYRWKNKYFGSIYLARGYFGPEIFEHEKMHIMLNWMDAEYESIDENDHEDLCLIAGKITSNFWKWFYDIGLDKFERLN